MIKLYKSNPDGKLAYHEAWSTDEGILEHWGVVGEVGEHRQRDVEPGVAESEALERVLAPPRAAGFAEIDAAGYRTLVIEYGTDGEDEEEWVEKGEALEEELSQFLGWTGLGDCDGGELDGGVLEVACVVVDFDVAAEAIAGELRGTEYGEYRRIYERV